VLIDAARLVVALETICRREEAVSITDEMRICIDIICKIFGEAGLGLCDIVTTTC
jgi:hypothetical protein